MSDDQNKFETTHVMLRQKALKLLKETFSPLRSKQISVTDCSGHIAAETICSEIDLPEHDRSAMDGFALASIDTLSASADRPARLRFSGEIRPSASAPHTAKANCAVRLLTGGIVPHGADAVIPFEDITTNQDFIEISFPVKKGIFIRKAGSDIQKGETIVTANTKISPCQAALLAYAGIRSIPVRKRPSIAVLAVGNELCDPSQKNECGLIPADNLILLKSLCKNYGVKSVTVSPCENSPEAISAEITNNSHCDIIITTGGTGPGNRDFVYNSVTKAGGSPLFKGLAMHPAKSIFACRLESSIVIGLPGPPNAVNLAFHTVIKPVINILLGLADISPNSPALLKDKVKGTKGREKLRPCLITEENGQIYADPLNFRKLSPRKIMSISNGIIVLPPDCGELENGNIVQVIKCS
ncbi:molybdopterin molybdotransferase MoeA [Maridesulfovibrio hydrothermalis]|uniref:molybdopterin molybdotransferase MoeA n=1 Tax=Maridesulfovibrio hydrothermalis TaxID=191026 RepID=UPI0004807102|nr:molybdopterin molybdotransferase MoeA [Maridesulfovibrio hydrothermalis]